MTAMAILAGGVVARPSRHNSSVASPLSAAHWASGASGARRASCASKLSKRVLAFEASVAIGGRQWDWVHAHNASLVTG